MFKFVLYSIQNIFFRDSKFISLNKTWISKNFINIVIDDFLNRWHLRNFIKNDKNEVTFNDCLKHSHKIKIRKCHIAKQSFARIFDRYCLICVFEFSKREIWSLDFDKVSILLNKRRNWFKSNLYKRRKNVVCSEIFDEVLRKDVILSRKTWS